MKLNATVILILIQPSMMAGLYLTSNQSSYIDIWECYLKLTIFPSYFLFSYAVSKVHYSLKGAIFTLLGGFVSIITINEESKYDLYLSELVIVIIIILFAQTTDGKKSSRLDWISFIIIYFVYGSLGWEIIDANFEIPND